MTLQYKDKNRLLKVKMLDGTVKTVLVRHGIFLSQLMFEFEVTSEMPL